MNEPLQQSIFSDLANLEKSLASDFSGESARGMLTYFGEVAKTSDGLTSASELAAERQLAGLLVKGSRASQQIIRHVWKEIHGTVLAE